MRAASGSLVPQMTSNMSPSPLSNNKDIEHAGGLLANSPLNAQSSQDLAWNNFQIGAPLLRRDNSPLQDIGQILVIPSSHASRNGED